jgi:CBS domain-containing protein
MERTRVSDIMTQDPITIDSNANLLECAKKMVRKRVGSLIISDKKRLSGFISQRDVLWALIKNPRADLSKVKGVDISPKKISTVKPTATIKDVIKKMNSLKFDRFPVVDNGNIVGIVTAKDVLNFHPELYPELEEYANIREEQEKLRRVDQAHEEVEGTCDICGGKDTLTRFNGMMVCETCKNSL